MLDAATLRTHNACETWLTKWLTMFGESGVPTETPDNWLALIRAGFGRVLSWPFEEIGEDAFRVNLVGADLSGVDLYRANLYGADLSGANLKGANLEGARLEGANLEGANLEGANLEGANLEEARLYGANLKGALLKGANLYGADLEGANLYGANLEGANLEGANLECAYLYGADLAGANLRDADLYGADLSGANLKGARLYDADLEGANLYGANLEGARLEGANLEGANLEGANLEEARLEGANLKGALLKGTNLYGADLEGANLYGANLEGARLEGANLECANLNSADLEYFSKERSVALLRNLFVIADAAKNVGEYRLANIIFAVVANKTILWPRDDALRPQFVYEHNGADIIGALADPDDVGYYDLVGVAYEGRYMCIPLPLLSKRLLNKVIRCIQPEGWMQRGEHNRRRWRLGHSALHRAAAQRDLWRRYWSIVLLAEHEAAVRLAFGEEDNALMEEVLL